MWFHEICELIDENQTIYQEILRVLVLVWVVTNTSEETVKLALGLLTPNN